MFVRFDGMETADWEPDRRTVTVRMSRSATTGRLGVKISHTPSGIYVDSVEPEEEGASAWKGGAAANYKTAPRRLCRGDRLLAVNGCSIEHLGKMSKKQKLKIMLRYLSHVKKLLKYNKYRYRKVRFSYIFLCENIANFYLHFIIRIFDYVTVSIWR